MGANWDDAALECLPHIQRLIGNPTARVTELGRTTPGLHTSDGAAEVVVLNMVVMGEGPSTYLQDAKKLLGPGGRIILSLPHPWYHPKSVGYDQEESFIYDQENHVHQDDKTHVHRPLGSYLRLVLEEGYELLGLDEPRENTRGSQPTYLLMEITPEK